MQERLFKSSSVEIDLSHDPYEETRAIAKRIAAAHGIAGEEAFELLLAYGSEAAVRRALEQRWWLGEIDRIDDQAA